MESEMRYKTFDRGGLISVFDFLSKFKTTRNSNLVPNGALMWLSPFFIRNSAAIIIKARPRLLHSSNKSLVVALHSYCDIVSYLSDMYATNKFISKAVNDITSCSHLHNATSVSYAKNLCDRLLAAALSLMKSHKRESSSRDFPCRTIR